MHSIFPLKKNNVITSWYQAMTYDYWGLLSYYSQLKHFKKQYIVCVCDNKCNTQKNEVLKFKLDSRKIKKKTERNRFITLYML